MLITLLPATVTSELPGNLWHVMMLNGEFGGI
jgi:hypothetical protein